MDEELGQEPEQRRWWTAVGDAGRAAAPYWFVASGVVLGVGGIVQDKPLAGACGAVAGITAGLLERQRASVYRNQALSMRNRLRKQRAKAEATEAELRETISTLQTEIWEHRMFSLITANMAAAKAVTASAEEAEPVDAELMEPEVDSPTEILGVVEEPVAIEEPTAIEASVAAESETDAAVETDAEVDPDEPAGAQVIQLHEAREANVAAEETKAGDEPASEEKPDEAPEAQAG